MGEESAAEKLFLLEFLVDYVCIERTASMLQGMDNDQSIWNRSQTCVTFQFLDYPPLDITQEDFATKKCAQEGVSLFKNGKSCLFSVPKSQIAPTSAFAVDVCVHKKLPPDMLPGQVMVGSTTIQLVDIFNEIVNIVKRNPECVPISKTMKDSYLLSNSSGNIVGEIKVFIRLSCFGKLIVTQFELGGGNKPFLFKGSEGTDVYECQKLESKTSCKSSSKTPTSARPMMPMYPQPPRGYQVHPIQYGPQSPYGSRPPYPPQLPCPPCATTPGINTCAPEVCEQKEDKDFEEIGAEVNGHELKIRVPKKKKKKKEKDCGPCAPCYDPLAAMKSGDQNCGPCAPCNNPPSSQTNGGNGRSSATGTNPPAPQEAGNTSGNTSGAIQADNAGQGCPPCDDLRMRGGGGGGGGGGFGSGPGGVPCESCGMRQEAGGACGTFGGAYGQQQQQQPPASSDGCGPCSPCGGGSQYGNYGQQQQIPEGCGPCAPCGAPGGNPYEGAQSSGTTGCGPCAPCGGAASLYGYQNQQQSEGCGPCAPCGSPPQQYGNQYGNQYGGGMQSDACGPCAPCADPYGGQMMPQLPPMMLGGAFGGACPPCDPYGTPGMQGMPFVGQMPGGQMPYQPGPLETGNQNQMIFSQNCQTRPGQPPESNMFYKVTCCPEECTAGAGGACKKAIKIEPQIGRQQMNALPECMGRDVFILRLGKKGDGPDHKDNLELELRTPKRPPPPTEMKETQYEEVKEDKVKDKKGKGKEKGGGKKGKKGKKKK